MGKREVSIKKKMELDHAVSYLQSIVDSLKEGKLCIEHGTDCILLNPAQLVEIEIEATQKKEKEKIQFEMKWNRADLISTGQEVKISSVESPNLEQMDSIPNDEVDTPDTDEIHKSE